MISLKNYHGASNFSLSRYKFITVLLIISVVCLWDYFLMQRTTNAFLSSNLVKKVKRFWLIGVLLTILLTINQYYVWTKLNQSWQAYGQSLETFAYEHPNLITTGQFINIASTETELVAQGLKFMKSQQLGPFKITRKSEVVPEESFDKISQLLDVPNRYQLYIEKASAQDNHLVITGWVLDLNSRSSADLVIATFGNNQESALMKLPDPEPDIELKGLASNRLGWRILLPNVIFLLG